MISTILFHAASRSPQKSAIHFNGEVWTYQRLTAEVFARAAFLQRSGVVAGDRVALLASNSPLWLSWYAAINTINAVAVPINPAYTAFEVQTILEAADLTRVILDRDNAKEDLLSKISPAAVIDLDVDVSEDMNGDWTPPPLMPEAPAVIYFSSGSTGKPKGIVHTGENLERIARCVSSTWHMTQDEVSLVAMPLAFIYASTVAWLSTMYAGGAVVVQSRFDAQATSKAISDGLLTNVMGVPMMFRKLVEVAGDTTTSRMRFALCSGDGLSRELEERFHHAFNCRVFEFFGLSEMPHVVAHSLAIDSRTREFSCGRAVCGVELEIRGEDGERLRAGEIGELTVRSEFAFTGYFHDQASTDAVVKDGWFSTGDLVRQDDEGYIYFVERKKELIKSNGFNILPGEVEKVIATIESVHEVAVVGVPHPDRGQAVHAYVVLRGQNVDLEQLRLSILTACSEQLAKYKMPEVVEFLTELPRGPTGKLQKKQLVLRLTVEPAVGDVS